MTRIGYKEDEDYPGEHNLWQANCRRSLSGQRGQAALRELESALLALPTKRLIAERLDDGTDCCAIGAVVRQRGLDPNEFDEEAMEEVGEDLGFPRLVAWKVVEANDIDNEDYTLWAPGPNRYDAWGYTPGYQLSVAVTPEERYDAMLKWIRSRLSPISPPIEDQRNG